MRYLILLPLLLLSLLATAPAQALEGGDCTKTQGAACEKKDANKDKADKPPAVQPVKPAKNPQCTGDLKKAGLCSDKGKKDNSGFSLNPLDGLGDKIAAIFTGGAIQMIKWMSTWWVNVDAPQITGDNSTVAFVRGTTHWLVGFSVALGLLITAGRTAWERRGEPVRQALSGLVTLIVVSGCSVVVVDLLLQAGDSFSEAVLNASTSGDVSTAAGYLFGAGGGVVFSQPGVAIVLALLVLISGLIQFAMMLLRSIMVVILAGLLPLAAASSTTQAGRAWMQKMMSWLLAYILFKPAAALVYAVAFRLMQSGDGLGPVEGLILLMLAWLTLPALLHLLFPMTGAAISRGGGLFAAAGGVAAFAAKQGGGDDGPTGAIPALTGNDKPAPGLPPGDGKTDTSTHTQVQGTEPPTEPVNPTPPVSKPDPSSTSQAGMAETATKGAGGVNPVMAAQFAAQGAQAAHQKIESTFETPLSAAEGASHG